MAGDPPLFKRIGWMPFVTQAGVGLGLATKIALEFPDWGAEFASIVVAVIVVTVMTVVVLVVVVVTALL